jgi:uncharacterized repeat protein (TIGR01451 family)
MRSVLMVLTTAVSMVLLACGVAVADTVTTDFESFQVCSPPQPVFAAPCTVDDQDGWKSGLPGEIGPSLPIGYDQQVVANSGAPSAFGAKSLRISNAYNTAPPTAAPEYHSQTYSTPTAGPAGESLANTEYTAQFSFISTKPNEHQPDLHMDVSPDNGEGGRMSYIGLTDKPAGIRVTFYDVPEPNGAFVSYYLGTLTRNASHTITFWIKLNPGRDNDRVAIFIDGGGVGRCFTTWENSYPQPVPISDRLLFRSTGAQVIQNLVGYGYLFDNVTTTTANGPGPAAPDCAPPIDIDKTTQTRSALPGDTITYRISVRNRGDAPVRGLRACDRVPRALRFVGASARLRHAAGRRLCRTIPLLRPGQRNTFRASFQLRSNVTAQTVTNGGSVDIPDESAPLAPPLDIGSAPSPPDTGGVLPEQQRRRRVARDAATIRVRRPEACGAAVNPRAHAAC